MTGSMEAALGIEHLIGRLVSLPSPEATQALQALSSEDALPALAQSARRRGISTE